MILDPFIRIPFITDLPSYTFFQQKRVYSFCDSCLVFECFFPEKLKWEHNFSVLLGTHNPDILLHDCQKWGFSTERRQGNTIGVFLKVHITSTTNRTWSAVVLFCRRGSDFFANNVFSVCNTSALSAANRQLVGLSAVADRPTCFVSVTLAEISDHLIIGGPSKMHQLFPCTVS